MGYPKAGISSFSIGWLSDLQTMTREDLFGYYRRYYVPNNATLVIVGDVDTDAALRRVEHHFGAIQPGAGDRSGCARSSPNRPASAA